MSDVQFLSGLGTFFTSVMSMFGQTFDAFMGNVVTRILIELAVISLIVDIVARFVARFTGKQKQLPRFARTGQGLNTEDRRKSKCL